MLDQDSHGIGSYINQINKEYQRKYNTNEVIFNEGDTTLTVERENTTVQHPREVYNGSLPLTQGATAAYTPTGIVIGTEMQLNRSSIFLDFDGVNNAYYIGNITKGLDIGTSSSISYSGSGLRIASNGRLACVAKDTEIDVLWAEEPRLTPKTLSTTTHNLTAIGGIAYDEVSDLWVITDGNNPSTIEIFEVNDDYSITSLSTLTLNIAHDTIEARNSMVTMTDSGTQVEAVEFTDPTNPNLVHSRDPINNILHAYPRGPNMYFYIDSNAYLVTMYDDGSGFSFNSTSVGGGDCATGQVLYRNGWLHIFNARNSVDGVENRFGIYEVTNSGPTPSERAFTERDFFTDQDYVSALGSTVMCWDSQNSQFVKLSN